MERLKYLSLLEALNYGLDNEDTGSVKYFRSDLYSRYIWSKVLTSYYKKENICSEDLLSSPFLSNISRPTVFKIIDNAVAKNYFIKEKDSKDHRKGNIVPSKITIKEFEEWSEIFSKLYDKAFN